MRAGSVRALVLLFTLLAAPILAQECPFPGQKPKLVVQLFFSQSVQGREPVGGRAWQRFLAQTVTPRLPDGFTIYDARGQWMDPRTHVISREQTKVVMVAVEDSPALRAAITEITDAYRKRFNQQLVGVLTSAGCGAF